MEQVDIFEGKMAEECFDAVDSQISESFDSRKRLAIELLGRGDMKFKEVAESVGIGINTLDRWRKIPAFAHEVKKCAERLSNERKEKIMDILDESMLEAVNVMKSLLHSDNDSVKLKAAQAIIDTQKKMTTEKDGAIAVSFGAMPSPVMPIKDLDKGVD